LRKIAALSSNPVQKHVLINVHVFIQVK